MTFDFDDWLKNLLVAVLVIGLLVALWTFVKVVVAFLFWTALVLVAGFVLYKLAKVVHWL